MDKLTRYRDLIRSRLTELAELFNRRPSQGVQTHFIFDTERDHYLLVHVGWSSSGRVWDTTLYVRLHEGKVWIEEDWTEEGLATYLLRAGVPKEDIVLAFHPPDLRPLTEFAVA
jgi:hypothetical protein